MIHIRSNITLGKENTFESISLNYNRERTKQFLAHQTNPTACRLSFYFPAFIFAFDFGVYSSLFLCCTCCCFFWVFRFSRRITNHDTLTHTTASHPKLAIFFFYFFYVHTLQFFLLLFLTPKAGIRVLLLLSWPLISVAEALLAVVVVEAARPCVGGPLTGSRAVV